MNKYSIILCGGSGKRLWPLSRENYSKQFLKLYGENSLLQETFLRIQKIMPTENIFLITTENNYFNVFNQIKEIESSFNEKQIVIEPQAQNTAPAVALAIQYMLEKANIDVSDPILISPADHYIKDINGYINTINSVLEEVGNNLGTIGIKPTKPHTGFGYIKKGEDMGFYFQVAEFKEKPDKRTAQKYLKSGQYLWNSGVYLFNTQTFQKEINLYAQEIGEIIQKGHKYARDNYSKMPRISIDYALSEKSKKMVVFEGDFGWSDIGAYDNLAEIISLEKNQLSRQINIDSENVFAYSESGKLIATIGIKDINIIESADSILIQKKGTGEQTKELVKKLKKGGYKEVEHNIFSHRPWGMYQILIDVPGYKVKKIVVYPGNILSLQSHFHRAEHWIVTRGVAKVTRGEEEIILKENESIFIPSLTQHRIENPGKIDLEIIEVQTGSYLGEDDIVRIKDKYNRN